MRGLEQIPWLYDAFGAIHDRMGMARWRRWLAAGACGRTLEIGCGTGRNLPLYPAAVSVIAVEPAAAPLLRARHRAAGARLVRADAQALPFRDATFDTVVSSLVFCSVPDVPRGLAEVRRVLRRDGALRMIEHVRAEARWKARCQDRLEGAWARLTGGCHWNRETERAVQQAGFAIESATRRARGEMRRFAARPVQ